MSRENKHGSWKECKYLGSKFDTEEEDRKHRTSLAIIAMNNLTDVCQSYIKIQQKMQIFKRFYKKRLHIQYLLVDNVKSKKKKIDATHRTLSRREGLMNDT